MAIHPNSTAEPITDLAAFILGWIDLEIECARKRNATPAEIADSLARLREHLTAYVGTRDVLRRALEVSVKLQSHYATLLNMHDGGRRIPFADADAWIARLRETGTLPPAHARPDYVGERPGRCDICERERTRTAVIGDQRVCDDCFYRLRDVPKR